MPKKGPPYPSMLAEGLAKRQRVGAESAPGSNGANANAPQLAPAHMVPAQMATGFAGAVNPWTVNTAPVPYMQSPFMHTQVAVPTGQAGLVPTVPGRTRLLPQGTMFIKAKGKREPVPGDHIPNDGDLFAIRIKDLPGVQQEMGFNKIDETEIMLMYLKDKGPHFSMIDMAKVNYKHIKHAKDAIMNAFQPNDPSDEGDGATGKLILNGIEYPSMIKKQVGMDSRQQQVVLSANAGVCKCTVIDTCVCYRKCMMCLAQPTVSSCMLPTTSQR